MNYQEVEALWNNRRKKVIGDGMRHTGCKLLSPNLVFKFNDGTGNFDVMPKWSATKAIEFQRGGRVLFLYRAHPHRPESWWVREVNKLVPHPSFQLRYVDRTLLCWYKEYDPNAVVPINYTDGALLPYHVGDWIDLDAKHLESIALSKHFGTYQPALSAE